MFLGRFVRATLVSGACLVGSLAAAQAQAGKPAVQVARPFVVCDAATRIVDPKLQNGSATFTFHLDPSFPSAHAVAEVRSGASLVRTLWSGTLFSGAAPTEIAWDGRDASGVRCATGSYTFRVSGPALTAAEAPVEVVRLGVTEIEAQDAPAPGTDEFQMVYFKKGTSYAFYATPAIHEYVNVAPVGGVSDLDNDDGEPRPPVAVHTATAAPVVVGSAYATDAYNYPIAYLMGASPRLELTFGASATAADGAPMGVGLPVAGHDVRVVCDQGAVVAGAELVTAGGTALVDLAPLPAEVTRTDLAVTFRFEGRAAAQSTWVPIPGTLTIPLRFFTILGAPQWKIGASGTQYAGPWVEVADDVHLWQQALGVTIDDQASLTLVHVKGFFGQNGGIADPIEDVLYDCGPLGGDGGTTHYFSFSTWNMNLARLLNGHASGRYVNCSDNMGASTTMLSMMGATNVRSVRLGSMDLRALWGIGAPGYTLDLWGGSHGFSYHHIITDDGAVSVSDSCMQLDEDGVPTALPSTPGWNVLRPWAGVTGYQNLAADNPVSRTVEALPGLQ